MKIKNKRKEDDVRRSKATQIQNLQIDRIIKIKKYGKKSSAKLDLYQQNCWCHTDKTHCFTG
jgi:hypothetical protein